MSKLCFCSAAFGSWGIVRLGSLVPECQMLFVCPFSCGRHNSIGALKHGYKDKISYLFIDEHDIALGTVDEDLPEAVANLVEVPNPPKVMLIYFSCVLYMSGFDWDAAMESLSLKYPHIQFRAAMMNPIAGDSKNPPVPAMVRTLCSLWNQPGTEPGHNPGFRRREVNLLGNYTNLDSENELPALLKNCGIEKVNHFTDFDKYEDYAKMSESCLNLVVRPEGLLAAKAWKDSMDYCFVPVSYDLDEVHAQYMEIFEKLAKKPEDMAALERKFENALASYEEMAGAEIEKTLKVVGDKKIAVGSSAVCRPFSLARALMKYGFKVSDVFAEGCPAFEQEAKKDLEKEETIEFYDIHHPAMQENAGHIGSCDIAVGYSAGYYSGAEHIVDLMIDEGMFGYGGICRLMKKLREAAENTASVENMIESYGLII